jgi:sortase A
VLARVLAGVGRTLIAAGVLVLLFVAYQLWGTGIRTAQAQNDLEDDLAARLEAARAAVTTTTSSTTTTTTVDPAVTTTSRLPPETVPPLPPELLPTRGEAAGRIVIPTIGVDYVFVEGVSVADLRKGPGHYPETPMPGQAGNAAIAGHRTTYGAPFGDLDKLVPGDEVHLTTVQGEFTYVVRETQIVRPSQVEVLDPDHWAFPNALTLTACHPKYSARQRIVVGAELVGDPAPAPPPAPPDDTEGEDELPLEEVESAGLSGADAPRGPVVAWGAVCAAIWLAAWAVGRRWRRLKWPSYAVGLPVFLVALFFFFEELSRLLPANY